MKLKKKVGKHNLIYTDHFLERLEEREISFKEIFYILYDKYNEISLYPPGRLLLYSTPRVSFIFKILGRKIILITAMDHEAVFAYETTSLTD